MPVNETLNLKITFDEKGAIKAVQKLDNRVKKSAKNTKKASAASTSAVDKIRGAYILLAGVITGVVAVAFKKVIGIAKDFEEANAKFGTVFRNNSREANAMRKELVDAYGLSTKEATKFLSTVQDFLVPMGFARDKATGLSGDVVKLARDLASFNNLRTEDVIRDITGALTGVTIPMKKYGVIINETQLNQFALKEGLEKTTKQMTSQEKASLILKKIYQDSGDAMGDYKRTSDSFANTLRNIGGWAEDIQLALGQKLITQIAPTIKEFHKFVKTEKGIRTINTAFKTLALIISVAWKSTIKPTLLAFKVLLSPLIESAKNVGKAWEAIKNKNFKELKKVGLDTLGSIKDTAVDAADTIKEDYMDMGKDIAKVFKDTEALAIEGTNNIKEDDKKTKEQLLLQQQEQDALLLEEQKAKDLKEFELLLAKLESEKITIEEFNAAITENMLANEEIKRQADEATTKARIDNAKKLATEVINSANMALNSLRSIGNSRMTIERNQLKHMQQNRDKFSKQEIEAQKKKMREIAVQNKKLKIAQAIIDGAAGVVKALAATPWPPVNAGLAALTATAVGFQVAAIKSQPIPKFARGGTVGGTGGTDSQLVAATPGETMFNPTQSRNLFNAVEAAGLLNSRSSVADSSVTTTTTNEKRTNYNFNAPVYVSGDKSFEKEVNTRLSEGGDFV